ncbi:glycosyltransferase [Halorarum halophilum]|uniref:Glycosyltransferase n=1 Tax=Halorarum halophilum TaxID=2743090 RepID=A0A7D5GE34_9EURY|nr:glycosyltransferase [Halobaculum halophilum]QLG29425.1 glycosyltransferase [Halobaculum halophilum]
MSPPPTSVILPTIRWTSACDEVADQLEPDDELLVVADDESDPVADHLGDLPDGVRLVFAGEPERCSGKANAIAAGMEAAEHDRLVWTDDDFHHPSDWLSRLHADYAEHGPVSEVPFFVGRDPLSTLLEPIYAIGGTLGAYANDKAWGGGVLFERDDLDEAAFLRDLRRTVSDDGLLSEHLDVTPLRRARRVDVGGTVRETLERHARFCQIVHRHEPRDTVVMGATATATTAPLLLFPWAGILLSTLLVAAVYAAFGVRRWTALLAFPAMILQAPALAYGLARRTFVWGGRRYRWRSKFDVEVLS